MSIIYSSSTDVYHNLAMEDAMLDDDSIKLPVVFVYRNDNAVVLGKNQNPWRECNVGQLDKLGVRLARRVTGGGTVFHDPGNINLSLVLPRDTYNRCDVLQWTMNGLKPLGIESELANDTSIVVGGKKVSGNAFCYRRNKVLHHGTLLWDTNLELLRQALMPALTDIDTRAIASIRMDVVNLKDLLPQSSVEEVTKTVVYSLSQRLGIKDTKLRTEYEPDALSERVEKMRAWNWLYGNTPDFKWVWRMDGQESRVLDVHRGKIRSADGECRGLAGCTFSSEDVSSAIDDSGRKDWLKGHPF